MLRQGEEYLSTNWLEYFHSTERATQVSAVRQAMLDKGWIVRRTAFFVVLNVGTTVELFRAELNQELRFVNLDEPHDPSHTGIYGMIANDTRAARLLAASVNPNEVYPAIQASS